MQTITDTTLQTVTPKCQTKQELTDQLVEKLFKGHKTFSQACKELNISRPRGYRLWEAWKQSDEAQLVDCEWWDLYLTVKQDNPEKALECLTRLKYRMTTEKREINKTVKAIKLSWDLDSTAASEISTTPETIRVSSK